ncbi:UbiA family prenyltransferase [Demequina muriae]|uniref:UbiA family prenyltransferase n=1 Tax=Demequina muriae TaxID=3051664 RepID=A0ABT8GJY7_9MICO|nr:UbiA family prenyltransferase [Demequina sp. EGI L300058]MDN4481753.1 UbiA family prenyltransferase [Demequina sp. EGI L300058]
MSEQQPAPGGITAVDLDGTLLRSDLLWEAAARHATSSGRGPFDVVRWAVRGRAHLKSELASRVPVDAGALPYRTEVVDELAGIARAGGRVILATAAARSHADPVAAHLGFVEAVLATDADGVNLRGDAKADAIEAYADGAPWTYWGDSLADVPVWRRSDAAVVVDAGRRVTQASEGLGVPVRHVRTDRPSTPLAWRSGLRVHQWAKNALVLVPLLTGHLLFEPEAVVKALAAVAAFSAMASAIYLINDLADLSADRAHATKRHRALAAGWISVRAALVAAAALVVVSVAIAAAIGWLFTAVVVVYAVATTLYSLWIKRKIVADVVGLAMLYTWRIIAGCAAINVVPSIWILAFSVFLFFSLAVMKRYAEIVNHDQSASGRDYHQIDAPLLLAIGTSSGMAAVLVAVLYLDSPQVYELYSFPPALWAVIPLLVYWIVRFWMVAARGGVDDDPLVFALTDRTSLMVFALIGVAGAVGMVVP